MAEGITYARPPIVEALLDIHVCLPESFSLESLLKCQQKVKKDYPKRTNAQAIKGEITFGPKLSTSASSEPAGYIFASDDGKQVFQAKRTGFTFNRLAPYPGWDGFFGEAKRLWEEYRRITRPTGGYSRLALRYINRFDFPTPGILMEDYFRTYVEVSRDLPQVMEGCFVQFSVPMDDILSTATITKTMANPIIPGHCSVILDIDLYRTESLPTGAGLWEVFEKLRDGKSRIFEACLTDKLREMIR